jgi:hypothetical protein
MTGLPSHLKRRRGDDRFITHTTGGWQNIAQLIGGGMPHAEALARMALPSS